MGRKKMDKDHRLCHEIKVRVNKEQLDKLLLLMRNTRHKTASSLLREIATGKPIATYVIDESLSVVMEELSLIRKEINRIGVNVNQVTRHVNANGVAGPKTGHLLTLLTQQQEIDKRVAELFPIISQLSRRWLQS